MQMPRIKFWSAVAGGGLLFALPSSAAEVMRVLETATASIFVWRVVETAGGALVLTIAILGPVALARHREKVRRSASATQTPSGNGEKPKTSIPLFYPIKIVGYLCLLVGVACIWPAFWEWLRSQKFLFWWAIIVLPLLALTAGKFKLLWWFAIAGIIITLLGADWLTIPSPRDWRLPTLETAKKAAEERQSVAVAGAPRSAEHWELCWTKTPGATVLDPNVREKCNRVVSFQDPRNPWRVEAQYESLGQPYLVTLEWDKGSNTNGSWRQEHPMASGRFQLKDIGGIYQGWYTDPNAKEEGSLWLTLK